MKITQMPIDRLNQSYLPLVRSALVVSTDPQWSFCILLCAQTEEEAIRQKELLQAEFSQPYLPQVVSKPQIGGMEKSIVLETLTFDELTEEPSCETMEKLLQADFLLWFDDGNRVLEDVIPVAAASGDLFWLVTDEVPEGKELYEVADGFCHPLLAKKGCCKRSTLARSLHGLICIKGEEVRRSFRRQAVKTCCEQGKKEISEEIAVWQQKRNQRFLQQMAYYYKFLRHWNSLDNCLSENGDYYLLLKEQIEAIKEPEGFGAAATELAREKSKEFFETWQTTFLHSIGWSRVCQRLKDDFYRVVLSEQLSDAKIIGHEPQNFADRLLGKKPVVRYNHYKEQALSELRSVWIPALRDRAKRLLADFEAEYRTLVRTYDAEWEALSEVYLELMKIQKQLPQEQLR